MTAENTSESYSATRRETLENNIYSSEETASFAECDKTRKIKLSDLLKHMINAAGNHYTARGVPYEVMYREKQIFVLSRISIKINRLPVLDGKFTVRTWENRNESVFFVRYFSVEDEKGACMCAAQADWLLINPDTRAIIRPRNFTVCECHTVAEKVDCPPCRKINASEANEKWDERLLRNSDTDCNGHFHSAFYAYYITDALPPEFNGRTPETLQINYISEALPGETVDIYGLCDKDKVTVRGTKDGTSCFTAELTFKNDSDEQINR